MKKDTVSKQIITPDNPPLPDDVGGRAHEPSVFLSVKFNRLSVTYPQDQPSQTKPLPPSKSQICLLKRKSTKKCSRDKTLLRKSKLSKLFVNKSVVFGDSFSGGLENFSRLSLEKKEKGEKEDQEEFHGHAFTDQSVGLEIFVQNKSIKDDERFNRGNLDLKCFQYRRKNDTINNTIPLIEVLKGILQGG